MAAPSPPTPSERFAAARAQTIRNHEDLYRRSGLGDAGTWLARPSPFVLDAIGAVDAAIPVVAYDLGAGVGRHTITMAQQLPAGSTVIAVDLLRSALDRLERTVGASPGVAVRTVEADLADFEFGDSASLIVAFSALEHLGLRRSRWSPIAARSQWTVRDAPRCSRAI